MTAKLVKARIKRGDWPEWFICCPELQRRVDEEIASGEVHEIDPSSAFMAEIECPYCGRIKDDVKYVRRAKGRIVISVDAYDLDEGPTA